MGKQIVCQFVDAAGVVAGLGVGPSGSMMTVREVARLNMIKHCTLTGRNPAEFTETWSDLDDHTTKADTPV